jgi:FtsH-binding integral membrane protein
MVMYYAIFCFRKVATLVPLNYISLCLYTIFETGMIASFACYFHPLVIVFCMVQTMVLFMTLTMISCFCKIKPRIWWYIIPGCFIVTIMSLLFILLFISSFIIFLIGWVFLIVACIYVVYDVYQVTSRHGLGYDDYIIASILIYMDLMMIFMLLLCLIGGRK